MDIAILVKEFPPDVIGGTETQTCRMARHLAESGHDVTVYTKSYPSAVVVDEPFSLKRLPTWHLNSVVSTMTFLLSAVFYFSVRGRHHDILQCMMIYPNGVVGYIVSWITGIRYFAWIRGGDFYFMKEHTLKHWSISKVLKDTTVLVQTDQIAEDVRSEFSPVDLKVIGNGVAIPETTADGDAIVFVGRLEPQKGVHVLLEAVADLPNSEQLIIVGDGSERKQLEAKAERLNVNATFVGEVTPDAVPEYLQRGKVFVLPAVKGEGLPNAMLEAMAAGLPVVVTDTGGVADGVDNSTSGFVVPPGDVDALRDRLKRLCSNEELRESIGSAARDRVRQRNSWDIIVSEIEEVYEDLVEKIRETNAK